MHNNSICFLPRSVKMIISLLYWNYSCLTSIHFKWKLRKSGVCWTVRICFNLNGSIIFSICFHHDYLILAWPARGPLQFCRVNWKKLVKPEVASWAGFDYKLVAMPVKMHSVGRVGPLNLGFSWWHEHAPMHYLNVMLGNLFVMSLSIYSLNGVPDTAQ